MSNITECYTSSIPRKQYRKKIFILVFIFVVLFSSETKGVDSDNYRQYESAHWYPPTHNSPEWKVKYTATTEAPNLHWSSQKEVESSVQKHKDEGGGVHMIPGSENINKTRLFWEIVVDGGRRNVSGMGRNFNSRNNPNGVINDVHKMYPNRVGLGIEVADDEKQEQDIKEVPINDSPKQNKQNLEDEIRELDQAIMEVLDEEGETEGRDRKKKFFKKMMMPLLIAYKLKFMTMVPILISALVLLAGSTGIAGFFFALFVAAVTNSKEH